ncbi:hypothetical protein [Rhizorhabdus argentea]|uniref:hypothetical protein n=1 Tax=Rhizorhabdus argentea TaxID=1387174 RepID=UPI0030EC5127
MDTISVSDSGSGFDAALKALEDLETSVVQTRDDPPAANVGGIGPIDFSAPDEESAPVGIMSIQIDDFDDLDALVAGAIDQPAVQPLAMQPVPTPPADIIAPAPVAVPEVVQPASAPRSPSRMSQIAIGVGLISSLVSGAGLIVAERTIMSAQLVVADARERQQQLATANALIHDLRLVRDRQIELLQAQRAQLANAPVSSEELKHRMEVLQAGLVEHDPMNTVLKAIQSGHADTNARFNEFGMKMARVEAALDGR